MDNWPTMPDIAVERYLSQEIDVWAVWWAWMIWLSRSPLRWSVKTTMTMWEFKKYREIDFVAMPAEQVKSTINAILSVN